MQTPLTFFIAFVVVLVLIGVVAWLVRRFAGNRLGGGAARGRMPRLAVIDAAAVDGRRRLVLVRRDNVEHLLMIGGPSDIVVEQNIVRAIPAREPAAPRAGIGGEAPPRLNPFAEDEAPAHERFEPAEPALPEPPPRPARPAFADELRRPAAPPVQPRHDPLATISPEPLTRPEPRPDLRAEPASRGPRSEPVLPRPPLRPAAEAGPAVKPPPLPRTPEPASPAAPTPSPAPDLAAADQNLAEMAKRLEAALRRPAAESRPAAANAASAPAPRAAPDVNPPEPNAPRVQDDIQNIEDEMASLLGRPKTPS